MSLPFFSSFLLTGVFILVFKKLFLRFGLTDEPQRFGYLRKPIPYGMGFIFALTFSALTIFFLGVSFKLLTILLSGLVITIVSFIDDYKKLSARFRLLVQLGIGLLVVLSGVSVPAISNPFADPFVLDAIQWTFSFLRISFTIYPLASLVALLWIIFVMNSLNWLDGAPGIVSGITSISSFILFLLASTKDFHVIDQTSVLTMSLIISASTLAFLLFDFPRPKILMGDSGTMFLGFILAVMAIYSGAKFATTFIVLAFPMMDAVWTIVRRLLSGQSPFKGDFQHFHHELLAAGFSERGVNIFFYAISFSFGMSALFLESFGKLMAMVVLFLLMIFIRVMLLRKRFLSSQQR